MRFRVATYNIHRARGLDWKIRPERIADVLREINADMITMQEVVQDHVPYLIQALGYGHAFGRTDMSLGGHEYGNLTLTRFPIQTMQNFDISVPRRTRRGCLRTDLILPGAGLLHLFHVHLGTSYFERRRQALKLLSSQIVVNRTLSGPRLVAGDFNEWTRGLVTRFLSAQLESADVRSHLHRKRTYPGMLPVWHLDHIYYDPDLKLEQLRLHRTPAALIASDHLPLIGDFTWDHSRNGNAV